MVTGYWGERLFVQRDGDQAPLPVDLPPTPTAWERFLAVRAGEISNLCPPEIALRMARLWEAIPKSASAGGKPVRL